MEHRSVADIEGPWIEPELNSGLIQRLRKNWSVSVCDLTNAALATFLRQKRALSIVLPEAQRRLDANFVDETELHDDELRESIQIACGSLA